MQKFVTHNLYGMNEYGAAVTEVLPVGDPKHVYLARDVDSEMILKDAIIAELKQSVATLSRSNTRLRQKIDRLTS